MLDFRNPRQGAAGRKNGLGCEYGFPGGATAAQCLRQGLASGAHLRPAAPRNWVTVAASAPQRERRKFLTDNFLPRQQVRSIFVLTPPMVGTCGAAKTAKIGRATPAVDLSSGGVLVERGRARREQSDAVQGIVGRRPVSRIVALPSPSRDETTAELQSCAPPKPPSSRGAAQSAASRRAWPERCEGTLLGSPARLRAGPSFETRCCSSLLQNEVLGSAWELQKLQFLAPKTLKSHMCERIRLGRAKVIRRVGHFLGRKRAPPSATLRPTARPSGPERTPRPPPAARAPPPTGPRRARTAGRACRA